MAVSKEILEERGNLLKDNPNMFDPHVVNNDQAEKIRKEYITLFWALKLPIKLICQTVKENGETEYITMKSDNFVEGKNT